MPEDHVLILRLAGDFYTKARKTRLRFQQRLARNIEDALESHGIPGRLETEWSRFYLHTPRPAEAAEVLPRVFGMQSVSVVERRPWESLEDVVRAGVEVFAEGARGRSFGVVATRRGDKGRIPFDSKRVEVELGRALQEAGAGRVDLGNPELAAHVELEPGTAYLFHDKARGRGGLPVGVEGRAVALVSGGFDSAVASWLLLKRGVELDYVFCNLGGTAHRLGVLKVMKVVAELWSYGSRPRLFEVDFQAVSDELRAKTSPIHWQVILKRLMVRAGERIALRRRRLGVVTGEAIGQVSSQTLQNLAVISEAAEELPLLRPLLGFNKEEILAIAREIGMYELAATVGEYCALVSRRPATRADLGKVLREEAAMDPSVLDRAVDEARSWDLRALDPAALGDARLETDRIEPGATIVDLRSATAYKAWHYPGALHLDFQHALEAFPSFPRDRGYVLVCEVGLKSAHLAERMQEGGFAARHLSGGIRQLLAIAERENLAAASLLAPALRD